MSGASETDDLADAFLERQLSGWLLYNFQTVSSTMDVAARLADEEERKSVDDKWSPAVLPGSGGYWCAVFGTEQTSGRGREGRSWVSGSGKGIYVSYLLPHMSATRTLSGMSLVVAIAVVRVLKEHGINAKHKWPNDVFAEAPNGEWKKIAGILVDASYAENQLRALVVGLGVDLESQGIEEAVSVREISGESISVPRFAAELSGEIRSLIEIFFDQGFDEFVPEWERSSFVLGKEVSISTREGITKGRVSGVSTDGALLLEVSGQEQQIYSGTLRLQGEL